MDHQLRAKKRQAFPVGMILGLALFLLLKPAMGQLVVLPNQTAETLVDELSGPGVLISNVSYTGAGVASGIFSNGSTTNLGLTNGVILTSGCAANAIGPNNSVGVSCDNNKDGDADLSALISPDETKDASVLEFDFIPALDTIQVRYVFGSDEYTEYIDTYNDVFAFFITGSNPNGSTYSNRNIALIPETFNTPVTIDNVNAGDPAGSACDHCEYYVDNSSGLTIEYDGFTTVLTAWALVVPCETYHMKFAIADAEDFQYDTGVFLEGGSFTSVGTEIVPIATTPNGDPFAVEGCLDIEITISPYAVQPTSLIVTFESIGGTAINGVDYTYLPLSHTIPANTASITLSIEAFNDGLIEGNETIIIEYKEVDCVTNTYTILIKDGLPQVTATFPNGGTAICDNTTGELSASEGFAEYFWDTSETTRTITVSPGNYSVVATDQYGCESDANITVIATASPPANTIMHH